jgi:hypothetical protein
VVSIGHFSPRAFAAAMSLTVTRPGRRPPYSGSDFSCGNIADDDIVGTSKSLEAPHWRTRTLR